MTEIILQTLIGLGIVQTALLVGLAALQTKRVGGITFGRLGRLRVSWCFTR